MTFRGLGLREWVGVWGDRLAHFVCGLRGHRWGEWEYEVPAEEGLGRGYRMCDRCPAWEEEDPHGSRP